MRPDSAVRLLFGAASSAVGRATRTQAQPETCSTVATALQRVAAGIEAASLRAGHSVPPRIVAVSKGQPVQLVQEAYNCGTRHFGESYLQELQGKAEELKGLVGIKWHFIGRLQKSKIKKLVEVPGLWMVETVSSCNSAKTLCRQWGERRERLSCSHESNPLKIMLQVNTSGEESKHGCAPEECADLGQFVAEECPHLHLCGLMTIGRQGQKVTPNPDFVKLLMCRELLLQRLKCSSLELSMGMTDDYEHAVELGSTNVRIGTAIFGPRV